MREPDGTCPLIDSVITGLPDSNNRDFLIGLLEDIRSNCEALREWGKEWQQTAVGYEDDLYDLKKNISRLVE